MAEQSLTDYFAEVEAWRREMDAQMRSPGPGGWLAIVGMYPLEEGSNTIGTPPASAKIDPMFGAYLKAGTPPEIVAKIQAETHRVLFTPEVKEKLAGQGADALGTTPAETIEFMRRERERMVKLIRDSAGTNR